MTNERELFIEQTMETQLPHIYAAAEKADITLNEDACEHLMEDSLRLGYNEGCRVATEKLMEILNFYKTQGAFHPYNGTDPIHDYGQRAIEFLKAMGRPDETATTKNETKGE